MSKNLADRIEKYVINYWHDYGMWPQVRVIAKSLQVRQHEVVDIVDSGEFCGATEYYNMERKFRPRWGDLYVASYKDNI